MTIYESITSKILANRGTLLKKQQKKRIFQKEHSFNQIGSINQLNQKTITPNILIIFSNISGFEKKDTKNVDSSSQLS